MLLTDRFSLHVLGRKKDEIIYPTEQAGISVTKGAALKFVPHTT